MKSKFTINQIQLYIYMQVNFEKLIEVELP